jgi:uncharacterized caspase-like protein
MALQPHDYALVIGINSYPHYGKKGRPLKGAVNDALDFATWLTDPAQGGGLPKKNCKIIRSDQPPSASSSPWPDHAEIDRNLEEIWDHAEENGARRFYFYFSGHGQTQESNNVALCLANWSRRRRHAAISSQKYLELILKCTPFQEVVILLDCCRLHSIGASGQRSELDCPIPIATAGQKRIFLAYATEFQKAAFESDTPEGTEEEENEEENVRGHFTQALMAGLRGGAAVTQGGVPASRLKEFLEKEVPRIAKDRGYNQTPQIPIDMPTQNEPIFGAAKPEANFTISFGDRRQGEIVLEYGVDLQIVKRGDAAGGPWNLTLEKGVYFLREQRTGEEKTIRFRPEEGVTHVEF